MNRTRDKSALHTAPKILPEKDPNEITDSPTHIATQVSSVISNHPNYTDKILHTQGRKSPASGGWCEMNCPYNKQAMAQELPFYISKNPPPDFVLPSPEMRCKVYHTVNVDVGGEISQQLQSEIMDFIRVNDCTDSGNITELSQETFDRLLSAPCFIGVILLKNRIVGTIFSIVLRVRTDCLPDDFLTSYTTFLCVARDYRKQGLAMALIRAVVKEGLKHYGIIHGYYMTSDPHHPVNNPIVSWYRPINLKKSLSAGFTLESFTKRGDRRASTALSRQKIAYHVSKPINVPRKVDKSDYLLIQPLLRKGSIYLDPTLDEFGSICQCFDVYIVDDLGLFMLFPMSSVISTSGKQVRNAQLALMIGDLMPHALWTARDNGYDLLYGWCASDISKEKVLGIRGLITTSKTCLEFYNTRSSIPNSHFMLPLF